MNVADHSFTSAALHYMLLKLNAVHTAGWSTNALNSHSVQQRNCYHQHTLSYCEERKVCSAVTNKRKEEGEGQRERIERIEREREKTKMSDKR